MRSSLTRHPEFFDGEVLKCAELPGMSVGEIRYPSACERPMHLHDRACFHFLFEGGYNERHGNQSSSCETLTLAFQPQGHEHSYRASDTVSRALTIEFADPWVASLREHSVVLDRPSKTRGGIVSSLISRLYREFCLMEAASPLVIEAIALEMAVETSRRKENLPKSPPPGWLSQVTDLIHDRFDESLSLRTIAQSVDVHPVHVARVFRQHQRCTVGEYLRRVRIDFACQQIVHSDSTLSEIALAAGFSDQSQFSHTFKRGVGLSPGRFRSEMRRR